MGVQMFAKVLRECWMSSGLLVFVPSPTLTSCTRMLDTQVVNTWLRNEIHHPTVTQQLPKKNFTREAFDPQPPLKGHPLEAAAHLGQRLARTRRGPIPALAPCTTNPEPGQCYAKPASAKRPNEHSTTPPVSLLIS